MSDYPEDVMKFADEAATRILQECVSEDRTSDYPGVEFCTSGATEIIARALLTERTRWERVQHAAEFAAKMCWRTDPPNANNKLTDAERLSAIKWHPTIKDIGQAHQDA